MIMFEKVSRFADVDLPIPQRGTNTAAGYDFTVAEDVVIPSYGDMKTLLSDAIFERVACGPVCLTLDEMAALTKETKTKPTLVSTGMKCIMEDDMYLELSVRSSTPLKHWLILANGVGIIDSDYANNPDNEGEIFFQLINLSPVPIQLKRGDRIGQGILKRYLVTDYDHAIGNVRLGGLGSTGN